MSDHVVDNNPKKEVLFALGGIVLFLVLVLIIGVSAFLRPAGEHITAEPTEASIAAEQAEAIAAEDTTDSAVDTTGVATADTAIAADSAETTTPADATVTPAPSSGDAIVATGSATATADGTVDQAAVADVDLTAEQADGDLDAVTE